MLKTTKDWIQNHVVKNFHNFLILTLPSFTTANFPSILCLLRNSFNISNLFSGYVVLVLRSIIPFDGFLSLKSSSPKSLSSVIIILLSFSALDKTSPLEAAGIVSPTKTTS